MINVIITFVYFSTFVFDTRGVYYMPSSEKPPKQPRITDKYK